MFNFWALYKTGFIAVQKSSNLHMTFRTRECQTSILGTVAWTKKECMKMTTVNMALYQENLEVILQLKEGLKKSWYFQT